MHKLAIFATVAFVASLSSASADQYARCVSGSKEYSHGKMLRGQTCDDGQWRGQVIPYPVFTGGGMTGKVTLQLIRTKQED